MATTAEETRTETIDNTPEAPEELGTPSPAGQELAANDEHQHETDDDEDAIENEVVVTIEGATPSPTDPDEPNPEQLRAAPKWVKEARKRARENERRYREEAAKRKQLEAQLAAAQRATVPAEEAPTLGPEPKLEDHDWDADRFKAALLDWADRKRKVEEHSAKQRAAIEAEAKAWQSKLQNFGRSEQELRVRGYPEAKAKVVDSLNVTQQGIIVAGAKNPALVTYALGSNPATLAELAKIQDPVQFAVELGRLETKMTAAPRKPAPPTPETSPRGTSPRLSGDAAELDRLRQGVADGTVSAAKLFEFKRAMEARARQSRK